MGKTSIKSKHELSTILPDIVIAGKSNIHLYNWSVFSERNMKTSNLPHGQSGPWTHSSKGKFFILSGLYKPIQGNCMCHLLLVELVGPTMWSTTWCIFRMTSMPPSADLGPGLSNGGGCGGRGWGWPWWRWMPCLTQKGVMMKYMMNKDSCCWCWQFVLII